MKKEKLIIVILIMLFACCSSYQIRSDHSLEENIRSIILSDNPIINMSQLTEFTWDSLIIVTPYASLETLQKKFNLDFKPVSHVGIEYRDDICLIVFFEDGKMVNQVCYPRGSGDFTINEIRFIDPGHAILKQETAINEQWMVQK